MKPNHSFSSSRRALIASAMAVLLGAATAVAQSTSTSAGTTGSSSDTTRRNQTGTPTSINPGGTYHQDSATGSTTARPPGTSGSTYESGTTATGTTTTTTAGTMTGRDKLSWGDRRFVHKAADGGQAEVQIARLAAERATNSEVRNFAQKLVDNHTKVNSELMTLAGQKNVQIDTDDDKDRFYKRLERKSGADFDQEFVEHMIDEHEKDVKMFEKAASEAKDPELRSFASKHVGHLREHLQTAESLRQTLMPTGRIDDSSGRSTPGGTPRDDSRTRTLPDTTPGTSSSNSDTSTTPRP